MILVAKLGRAGFGQEAPMLTLYGDVDSGNVYKVRLLLAQLGIAYRRVDTTQKIAASSRRFRAIASETATRSSKRAIGI